MFGVHFESLRNQPGVGSVYRRMTGRPGWVWGTAVAVGILPFAALLVLVALAAVFTTAAVFFILSGIDTLVQAIAGSPPERHVSEHGRENVRVIRPEQR